MKRKLGLFIIILISGIVVYGCSSSETSTKDGEVVLKALMEEVPDSDIVNEMVTSFEEENPGIQIDIEMLPFDQMRDKIVSSFLANESEFDIIVVDNPWMYDFSSNLEPLNERIEAAGEDYEFADFSEPLRNIATVDENIYGVPFYNYAVGLNYRQDLFEENQLTVPTTLDELQEVAQALTKDDNYGIAMQPQKGYKIFEEWANWLFAAGGQIQDADGNIMLDSPEAREALTKYITVFESSAPKNSANWAFDEAMRSVSSGESAMITSYNWMLPTLNNPEGPAGDLAGNFELAEVPGGKAVLGAWFWSIPANAVNKDESWAFINWITSKEQAVERVTLGGSPVRNSTMENPDVWKAGYGEPYYTTLQKILEDAAPLADGPNAEEMIQVVGTELNMAVTGQKSVDEAITDAAQQAKEVFSNE